MRRARLGIAIASCILALASCDFLNPLPKSCEGWTLVPQFSSVIAQGRTIPLAASLSRRDPTQETGFRMEDSDEPIYWRSSDPSIVAVGPEGVASALKAGAVTLTASSCAGEAPLAVTVLARPYAVAAVTPDGSATTGRALNDSGVVVGNTGHGPPFQNFLWAAGTASDLGNCAAMAVNDASDVLCGPGPAIWKDGSIVRRDTISHEAIALNDSGHVLIAGYTLIGILWRAPGAYDTLSGDGAYGGPPRTLNNRDAVLVNVNTVPYRRPSLRYDGVWRPLGFGRTSTGLAVNDSGDVAGDGEYVPTSGIWTAVVWLRNPLNEWVASSLGWLGAADGTINIMAERAIGINNARQVLGSGPRGAWVWSDGRFTLLDAVVPADWEMVTASAINNRGQVLAQARNRASGWEGAVLVTPSGL